MMCTAVLNIGGKHYRCQETASHDHDGIHRSADARTIWACSTPASQRDREPMAGDGHP